MWIPDTNARLAPSTMLRQGFPDADVHVVASLYGEDAHRRGWLRLDRTLTPAEHSAVVDTATSWSRNNRSLQEVVAEFGPPSVTFGSTEPDRPKTVSYATSDRAAAVVAFHLGSAQPETDTGSGKGPWTSPALLTVRVHDDFFGGWEITPVGESQFGCALMLRARRSRSRGVMITPRSPPESAPAQLRATQTATAPPASGAVRAGSNPAVGPSQEPGTAGRRARGQCDERQPRAFRLRRHHGARRRPPPGRRPGRIIPGGPECSRPRGTAPLGPVGELPQRVP